MATGGQIVVNDASRWLHDDSYMTVINTKLGQLADNSNKSTHNDPKSTHKSTNKSTNKSTSKSILDLEFTVVVS